MDVTRETTPSAALRAELTNKNGVIINDEEIFLFNHIHESMGINISYDPLTGEFTISEPGVYRIYWWLNVSGSLGVGGSAKASIYVNDTLYSSSITPVTSGQFSDFSFLIVEEPVVFKLVNTTNGAIALADFPIQGALVVYG